MINEMLNLFFYSFTSPKKMESIMKNGIKKTCLIICTVLIISTSICAADEFQSTTSSSMGLWFGTIDVNKVCEIHATSNDTVTPKQTSHNFTLPILLHVNESGNVNLLSEVTVMQYPSSSANYGQRVLITDQSLLANYEGVIRRNGKLVGIRLASPAFPMEYTDGSLETSHPMEGNISLGGEITTILTYSANHPTNPYRHHYHPDVDEGFAVTRTITLTFDAQSQAGNNTDTTLTGTYNESLAGLHKSSLLTEGRFILNWINNLSTLNP